VVGGHAPPSRGRGGAGIPPSRSPRSRLIRTLPSLFLVGGLGAWPALAAHGGALLLGLAAFALALLAAGVLARRAALLVVALAVLGAEYLLGLAIDGNALRLTAPAYGTALLVVAELAFALLEPTAPIRAEAAVRRRRAAGVVTLAVAGLAAAGAVEGVAASEAGGGIPLAALGAVGGGLALVLLLWLGRRAAQS
jgi:hypothetical protein